MMKARMTGTRMDRMDRMEGYLYSMKLANGF